MNKFYLVILIAFAVSCKQELGVNNAKTTIPLSSLDEGQELENIMKVIDNETKMFFEGNVDGWRASWSQKDYASQAWNNDDGTADFANGWDAINAQGSEWIDKYYKNGENVIHPDYKRSKIKIHFYSDNLAYLTWKQYNADKDKKYYRISGESRIMEKESDGWKIVNVNAFWDIEPKIHIDSLPQGIN
jgi:hypothetical protein